MGKPLSCWEVDELCNYRNGNAEMIHNARGGLAKSMYWIMH